VTETSHLSSVSARFPKRSARGLLLGFSAPRVAAIALAAAVAVTALATANMVGLLVSAIMWAPLAATAFVRVGGRPPAEWAATAVHYGGRRLSGQTEYRSRLPVRSRPAGTLALPGDAASLRFHCDIDSGAVMVHDPHRHTLAAVMSVSHPAFVLLDRDDQAQRVSRWGRLYAGLAQTMNPASFQVLEAVVPDPGDGLVDWYRAHQAADAGWADRQYTGLLDQARLGSSTHRTTISVALDLKAAGRTVKAAGGGIPGAAAVLRQDMASLADALRQTGLTVGSWLTEAELAAIIRSAYDPATVLDPRRDPGANLSHAGPIAISETWDRLRHNSAWSAVLWISEWPRIDVPPDFLHPLLFALGVRRTLSITARPLPADAALRQIRKEKTGVLADQAQKARIGQVADLSDAREYQDLLDRERSVITGHTDVEFTGLVTVTAPSLPALEAAQAAIIRAAGTAACELQPLHGRQTQAFIIAALPLARRPW
jgi:hypothetical protein